MKQVLIELQHLNTLFIYSHSFSLLSIQNNIDRSSLVCYNRRYLYLVFILYLIFLLLRALVEGLGVSWLLGTGVPQVVLL